MTKLLLAAVTAAVLISGVVSAQIYPPAPRPPPVPGASTTTTTTVSPNPDGDHRETTIHKEVDRKGNTVIEKDVHRGIAGSTDTHTKTETDRDGGTTTTTETTAKPK